MVAPDSPGAGPANRARRRLENDYRASVVYCLAGLAVLGVALLLFLTGLPRGSAAQLPVLFTGMGASIAALGACLIGINGWLLKRRWPHSPLPRLR